MPHNICILCGLDSDEGLHDFHTKRDADDWAANNKKICDLLHRGIVPKRLDSPDRADPEYWGNLQPSDATQPSPAPEAPQDCC